MMTYEFDANKYRGASDTQYGWGRRLIDELDLQGHEHILDLGCGDGRLTALLAARVPRGSVLGIDASTNMIRLARDSFTADNLTFAGEDIRNLHACDRYDVIYSNAALHWIHDHRTLLESLHRALRAGGRVHTSFASDRNCIHFKAALREVMARPKYASALEGFPWPWYMPSASAYETMVRGIPFTEAQTWIQPNHRAFPDTAALAAWVEQPCLVPFTDYLPPALGRSFSDEVVREVIERTRQPDGTCREIFNRLRFKARK